MKKTVLLTTLFAFASFLAAQEIWDGSLDRLSLREGAKLKDVSVKSENGVINISGTSEGDSVTYINTQIKVKPFVIAGKALALTVRSDTPDDTTGFYVRALTADNRMVLSFQKWGMLKTDPQKIVLVPESSTVMKWEDELIKAPLDAEIDKLYVYIGVRGDGKKMTLSLQNLAVVEVPKSVENLKLSGNVLRDTKDAKAYEDNGVITAVATGTANTVTYFDFNVPFTGDITGKTITFTAKTTTPDFTKALYVRGYNRNKECILSFMSWDGLLGTAPKEFRLVPGQNSSGLRWEPQEVKETSDQNLSYLRFYLGTRGNAGEIFDGCIEKLALGE